MRCALPSATLVSHAPLLRSFSPGSASSRPRPFRAHAAGLLSAVTIVLSSLSSLLQTVICHNVTFPLWPAHPAMGPKVLQLCSDASDSCPPLTACAPPPCRPGRRPREDMAGRVCLGLVVLEVPEALSYTSSRLPSCICTLMILKFLSLSPMLCP